MKHNSTNNTQNAPEIKEAIFKDEAYWLPLSKVRMLGDLVLCRFRGFYFLLDTRTHRLIKVDSKRMEVLKAMSEEFHQEIEEKVQSMLRTPDQKP